MKKVIRRPMLLLVALIVMPLGLGLGTTLWVIGAFLLYFTITSLSALLVSIEDMFALSWKIRVWFGASLIFAIVLFLFLFIRFGWFAAADFIVLIIAIPPLDKPQGRQKTQMRNRLQELLNQYKVSKQAGDLKRAIASLQELLRLAPANSPHRPAALGMLARDLETSYKQTGYQEDLKASIQVYQQALRATPPSSRDLPPLLVRLNVACHTLFERTHDPNDLSNALAALQQAIQALPPNDPNRPMFLGNMEIQLHERYMQTRELADLDACIHAIEQALRLVPLDSPHRSGFLEILGRRKHERYQRTNEQPDLDASIETNQQTIEAPLYEGIDQSALLNTLGNDLQERYERTEHRADLDAALAAFEQASAMTPPGSSAWLSLLKNLISVLRERYKRTGNQADLEATIAAFGKVVETSTSTVPDRHVLLSSLGQRQFEQHAQTGNLADLEMAIALFEQALQTTPTNSPDRIARLNARGVGLRERYTRTRRMTDLDAALRDFQQIVDATPSDSPDLLLRLNNLIVGLTERIKHDERAGDLNNLRTQISKLEQAMKTASSSSPIMLNSLGGAWLTLYERTDDLSELNTAIHAFEQAIHFATDSFNRSMCLDNLGTALIKRYEYTKRYEHTKNKADLDAAIINFQQAAQALPTDSLMQYTPLSNLACSLHQRFADVYNLTDLEAAISALERCWSILHGRFAAMPVIYQLGQQRQESVIAADLVTAYLTQAKIRAFPVSGRLLQTLDDVNGNKSLLVQTIATFALSLNNIYQARREQQHPRLLPVPPRVLEIIEGHKSRFLTQLVGRGPLLLPPGVSSEMAAREQQLLTELTTLDTEELISHDNLYSTQEGNAYLQLPSLQQRQTLLHELEDIWSHIAHISPEGSEYAAFRRGTTPSWEELTRLTEELGTTTVLLSFFVTVGQAVLVILRAGWQAPLVIDTPMNQADWPGIRRDLLNKEVSLKTTWGQPLLQLFIDVWPHIRDVERIIVAPAGNGHVIPWSVLIERAGWRTPTGEQVPLVTLPALSILSRLLRRPPVSPGPVLVVGDPRMSLPAARAEAEEVAERFNTKALLGTSATKSAVLTRFPDATLIHLATHARFKKEKPLESEIDLAADEVLTAREILRHRLQTDLLVLSACETGQVGSLGVKSLQD
jgi:tetratricopeptide (TPR) repeat protein